MKRTTGRQWQRIRARVLAERPLCVACDAVDLVREAVEVDHVIPVAKGGTDDEANLQPLCRACHKAKSDRDFGHRLTLIGGRDAAPLVVDGRGGSSELSDELPETPRGAFRRKLSAIKPRVSRWPG